MLGVAVVLALSASQALAQSGNVEARINRLENEIQTLSQALFRGEKPSANERPQYENTTDKTARAAIEVRLSQIEMDMRTLTGRVEELAYGLNQVRDKLDRKISDLEMRMSELEQQGSGSFGQPHGSARASNYQSVPTPPVQTGIEANPPVVTNPTQIPPVQGTLGSLSVGPEGYASTESSDDPAAMYEKAFSLVRAQNFDEAERAFRAFLEKYPEHQLSQNAKYWLAETHYVRGQHETAARHFAEAYQSDPNGQKAPDNLLKLGMSLAGMGSTKDACVALSQLQKEFPNGTGPILNRAEQEMQSLGCQSGQSF